MKPSMVRTDKGNGGLDRLTLEHASGATAEVYLFGAHLTSWHPPGQPDAFFVSRQALFDGVKPIRGGIPVIFPQFADDGPLPKHGLVRTQIWRVEQSGVCPDGKVAVTLALEDNETTRAVWPFRFSVELCIALDERLEVTTAVTNRDAVDFAFQYALHTYFSVGDIRRTRVFGLQGTRFLDCVGGNAEYVEDREAVGFSGETDRVYSGTGDEVAIRDEAACRTIGISKAGMPDVVVWNPWVEKSRRLADFGDDEYLRMVCVENGCIAVPVRLHPGQTWKGDTIFTVR